MKQRVDNNEFLQFADSYLREAFPNPSRTGCPADEQLQKLAEDPKHADLSLTQHISFCSPCYVRYAALLRQEKERMRAGLFARARNYWKTRPAPLVWAASAVIVLLCVAIVLVISRGGPKPTYSAFTIDLTSASPVRGTSEQPAKREIQVPQDMLDLNIQLPIGSEEGAYELSLRSGPNVLWSQVAQAHLIAHVVRLKTRVDLRPFSPGKYELTVESAGGLRFEQPIHLMKSKQEASRSGWRGHMLASVAARLISIRLPGRSREATTTSVASGDAGQLIAKADRLAWLGNWPAAAPLYGKAELLATQSGDTKATIHARVGRIRSQAETMPFAQVSEMLGAELENPIVQQDPKLRLFCLTAKGYTDLDVNLASCREAWEQALQTARELDDPLWESRASGELGIISFLEGDSAKAERLVGAALLSAMKNGDVAAQVRFLSMIGNGLADLQRYDDASQFFTRALKLASETKDIGFPFMAYEGQARCLTALDRPGEASKLLQTALEQARRDEKRGHEAQILILLGELRLATNKVPEAEKYLRDAGELSRTSQFRRMESEAMYQLATIYRNEGKLRETEECLRRGIDASRAVGDTYYLPRDLSGLAEVRNLSGNLKQADALWEQATDVLEGMLINAPSAYARSTMVAAASDIYLRHFELAATENDVTKAFRIVERARGRSVADLLWRRPSEKASAHHIDTSAERQITSLQVQLIRADSPKQRQELLSDLFEAEQKRSFALTSASKPYSVQRPAPLRSVQRALLGNEALLEYVLSDPDSYCLVLTRTGARLISLGASRGRIELLVRDYLTKIRSRKNADDVARRLYSILLARVPEVRTKPRVVVIPDGVLHLLPFDALQSQSGRYVLESSVVTYAPSGTVLRLLRLESRPRPMLPFIGVGDVTYDESPLSTASAGGTARKESTTRGVYDLAGAHFEPLPGSRDEVLGASEIFGPGSVVLLGREATEAAFKHEPLAKFRVLHLAVHGIASAKYPERAALVLGRDSKSEDDGLLQTREIANLALNADLVTLSACDTGVGRLQGEEGNASLQRAFLLAGAKTTLSTLWTADDTFTAALIKQFYKNLADGMDKGAALRTAKLELMKKFGDQAMPFYWAGFVLDGESSSPLFSRQ